MVDGLDSWLRVAVIFTAIVLNGMVEEGQILGAEFMMLVRWTRDVLRYDFRWIVQEKFLRVLRSERPRSTKQP
jgi:hypothetical protein